MLLPTLRVLGHHFQSLKVAPTGFPEARSPLVQESEPQRLLL